MKWNPLFAVCALTLAGCGQPPAPAATTGLDIPPPPTAPAGPKPTPEAWRAAFDSSFHVIGPNQDQGNGITKFDACFDAVAPAKIRDCHLNVTGEKDAFRKLWIFQSPLSGIFDIAPDSPYLTQYVSVMENHSPVMFFSANFIGESWLFMTDVAIMVNGDIVLEHHFDHSDIKTHVGTGYVQERSDFVLTSQQIAGLRKIHSDSKIIIRFTGQNGFVSVDHGSKAKKSQVHMFNTDSFASDVEETLGAYDAISTKTRDKGVSDHP